MSDTPDPTTTPPPAGRRYTIDDDGNVHGVVLTTQVDYLVEITCRAVSSPPQSGGAPAAS